MHNIYAAGSDEINIPKNNLKKTNISKTTVTEESVVQEQESDAKRARRLETVQKQLGTYNNDTKETKLKERR